MPKPSILEFRKSYVWWRLCYDTNVKETDEMSAQATFEPDWAKECFRVWEEIRYKLWANLIPDTFCIKLNEFNVL